MSGREIQIWRWRGEAANRLHRDFREQVQEDILRFAGRRSLTVYVFYTHRTMTHENPIFLVFRLRGTMYLAVNLPHYTIVYKMTDVSNHVIARLRLENEWDNSIELQ